MLKVKNHFLAYSLLTLIVLLLLKVDYRFEEIYSGGAQDDSSYYYHAQTIAIDKDLDYTNQLNGNLIDAHIREDNKPVPRQSFGPGLLSAPFLFFSNLISKYLQISSNTSFNYLTYSYVACFYLFLSLVLLKKIIKVKNISESSKILLFTFGSGVTYYAFERFSMSVVYEFFSVCLVIYLVNKIFQVDEYKYKKFLIFLLPIVQFFMLMNRWNNIHLFIVPVVYACLYKNNLKEIFGKLYFYLGNIFGIGLFLIHTKLLYGIFTLSQQSIAAPGWIVTERVEKFFKIENLFSNILFSFKYFINTCFSMEFGIFYFSAIIFSSIIFLIYYLFNKRYKLIFFLSIFYLVPFLPILVFENHAGSYGFRYLFTLIPLNIIIYFKDFSNIKALNIYLVAFSIFGIFSQLFFESTPLSSLSEGTITNSFNSQSAYSNPDYLLGLIKSLLVPTAYLKVIFTSFFGVLIIKFINILFSFEELIENYYTIDNQLSELLVSINKFSWIYFIVIISLIVLSIRSILYKTYE